MPIDYLAHAHMCGRKNRPAWAAFSLAGVLFRHAQMIELRLELLPVHDLNSLVRSQVKQMLVFGHNVVGLRFQGRGNNHVVFRISRYSSVSLAMPRHLAYHIHDGLAEKQIDLLLRQVQPLPQ